MLIVVLLIGPQFVRPVSLSPEEGLIQKFPSDTADQPLNEWV